MKTTDLQNALSNVDDKYITEAATYKSSAAKAVKVWRAIAIAACCLIAIPVTIFAAFMISDATGGKGKAASSQAAYDADYYYEATTVAETRAASNSYAGGAAYEEAAEYEYDEPAMAAGDSGYGYSDSETAAPTSDTAESSGTKIIRTADLDIQSTEYDEAVNIINALVEEFGGYFESRALSDGSGYRYANLTIRIPAENYDQFLEKLNEAGTITSLYEDAEDVSSSYKDLESRLETAKTKLARLQELLAQAEDMSDIITIESAISDTEYEIDYLQGCLNGYDSRVSYSTIYIYLREVYKVENPEAPLTFSEKISRAFSNGLEGFGEAMGDLAIWLAESWIWLLVIGVFIALSIIIPITCVRRARRKRNK